METRGASASSGEIAWVPPAVFEGYRLVRALGAGGMGRVYLCHDLLLDRPVAIKFIARPDPDGHRRERFLLEGRALARLVHANVVLTFHVGEVEGRPFLVSEFVAGRSLDQIERPVPWRHALDLGIGLARGLAAAHQGGIVHRDVKPPNVMLTPEGEVKLIDFGLAVFVTADSADLEPAVVAVAPSIDETESDAEEAARGRPVPPGRSPITHAGVVVGTRRYLAPERLAGRPATRQSDVFSLGCVLRELCGGGSPGGDASLPIDPQFKRIIESCLEPDPARRWPSAEEALRALEALADEGVTSGEVPPGNPYRGLESFEEVDRACFVGRSREVAAIVEKLRTEPVVTVAGDSGVGKSSLCKAGVIPRLAESSLVEGRAVTVRQLVPGRDPLRHLAIVLAELLSDEPGVVQERLLLEPAEVLRSLGRAVGGRTVVLFVDQAEELFTLATPEDAERFAAVLARLTVASSLLRLLIGVRGDFLARLAAIPGIGAEVVRAPYLLRPLSADKLREVIVVPARRSGVAFASAATVDELVRFAMSSESSLPLLQFTLAEMWEARDRATNVIAASTLAALGGVDGAFERHADRVLGGLSPSQRTTARHLLSRFVTSQETRASLTQDEVRERPSDERSVLETLIAGRLIVVRGSDEHALYELAHEALITRWSTLRQWLDEDAAQRNVLHRLTTAAGEWDRLGRRGDGLWSGRQLGGVETVESRELGARERSFLEASRARRRRGRILRVLVPLALLSVVLLGILAGRLRARAELAVTVSRSIDGARQLEEQSRAKEREAQELRVRAMGLFDEGAGLGPGAPNANSWKDAEQLWSRILESEAKAEAGYGRATAALESAMFVDPSRSRVREELARLIDVRLSLSDRMGHREIQAEMTERLRSLRLDDGGAAQAADEATLTFTRPPGADASVTVAPYVADGVGRLSLGPTRPLQGDTARLPAGSYLLMARYPGSPQVRIPVLLGRRERRQVTLPAPTECAVPAHFILIPASDSLTGSDEENIRSALDQAPLHAIHLPTFIAGRFEVTVGDYIAWLEALDPKERLRRTPNCHTDPSSVVLRRTGEQLWQIELKPLTNRYLADWGRPIHYPGRFRGVDQDWRRFPVTGVSFNDAVAYAAWLDATGRVPGAHVCRDLEWEKAARGADGRIFTTGRVLRPSDANYVATYGGSPLALGPDEVGRHPDSASPYGLDDVQGNVIEIVASGRWGERAAIISGSWGRETPQQRLDNRFVQVPEACDAQFGFRICAAAPSGAHSRQPSTQGQ